MTVVPLFFVVLFAALLVLVCIALHSQRKQDAMKNFSWRKLRYAFTTLAVLGAAAITFQPVTAHADTIPDITHVLCNPDQLSGQWTSVSAGYPASAVDGVPQPTPGTIYATGYTDPGYDSSGNDVNNCPGNYYYAWDQYYHQATWTWSVNTNFTHIIPNPHLQLKACRVQAYMPNWYAGAQDAQYSITIQPSIPNPPPTIVVGQDHDSGGVWKVLDFSPSGDGQGYIPLGGSNYTFTVTLQNGGAQWLYLAANAIEFDCVSSSSIQL